MSPEKETICSDISLVKECLWCNHTCWMRERMDIVIQVMSGSLTDQSEWFQQMCKDLSCCTACVDQYHNVMKVQLELCGSKSAIVYNWNCRRISGCLEEGLRLFDSVIPLDDEELCVESITLCIETAIKEVLKYPRLMFDKQLSTFFLNSLKLLLKRSGGFELHERLKGLCLLLFNEDSEVRIWALKAFKSFGPVDCDEYNELESVINWLLNVINFNLFAYSADIGDLANWDDTQNVLPHHLFTNKPREFWLGMCTIFTVMTKSCIQTCFLTSDLSHKGLLESVLALLDENPDKEYDIPSFSSQSESYKCKNTVFWPVLQCFVLLIEKLGSRFWMLTATIPNSVLKLIKSNPYYQLQLNICYSHAAQLDSAITNDNDFSFSQLVYDDSLGKAKSVEPIQERYHGFSLSWVVPFIKSLIDFGEFEASTVVELLDFVCHVHSVSLHGDTNVNSTDLFQTVLPIEVVAGRVESLFLSQESLKCITQSVDVMFSQKMYTVLLQCKQAVFCMITFLCSYVLSKGRKHQPMLKQHLSQTARTYTSLVMYCSNEKTASRLWYLVKQISSLSPFLSIVSSKVESSYGHTSLLQPDELCEMLLKLIANKQSNQDIAGPFLYPPSFSSLTSKKTTGDAPVIKQELLEEETKGRPSCATEIKLEPLPDHDLYHQGSSAASKSSHFSLNEKKSDDTYGGLDQKQLSLTIKKLPITVIKSEEGVLHYEYESDLNNVPTSPGSVSKSLTKPVKPRAYIESDTDSCSSNSDDDNDDLPSYFAFSKRRRCTDASTSSTITLESEFNEQLDIQRGTAEKMVKANERSSQSAPFKQTITTDNDNFASPHSDDCTFKQRSDEGYSKVEDSAIELKPECDMKHNPSAGQELCLYKEQNTDCDVINRSSSIIDMVLDCEPPILQDDIVEYSPVSDHSTIVEQNGPVGSELEAINNMKTDSGDEEVFCVIDEHTSKFISLDKQQQSESVNSKVDASFMGDEDFEPVQFENDQCIKSCAFPTTSACKLSTGDAVVVPYKYCDLKFNSLAMESETNSENPNLENSNEVIKQTNSDLVHKHSPYPSCVQHSTTIAKQVMSDDKIQPAVAGRAPFSKSRMSSLHIPSALNTITKKVQAGKTKDSTSSKSLHKNTTLEPMGQSSSVSAETSKAVVKVELSRVYNKEEFLMEVLSWDPTVFYQTKESSKSDINEGPYSLSNIEKVPVTFESSDKYIEVFKPLLLLETWDTIKEEIEHAQKLEKVFKAKIDDCNLSSVTDVASAYHRLTCKGIINANDHHPIDRDLVCIKCILQGTNSSSLVFPVMMFGIVEFTSKRKYFTTSGDTVSHSSDSSDLRKELTLHLTVNRYNCNFHFFSDNLDVEILTVVSMSSFIRQWEGLIAVSRNELCRDILYPRGKKYFGHFDGAEPIAKDRECQIAEFSFNASQFEAITLTTKALSLKYCIPQVVLLQGPPGTGKTHTIIGIITSFFANQKVNLSAQSNVLPGNRPKPPKPHLLVCAPSNAGIDVVVNRLVMNGLVVGTESWRKRCESRKKQGVANITEGFHVLRVGVPDKIDPQVFPVFLDEVLKKKTTEASKKLQILKEKIAKVHDQIVKLDEQITYTKRMIVSLKSGGKNDQSCCKELNANVISLTNKAKELQTEHRKLTREAAVCSNEIKMIHQKLLLEADVVCCTLTSSGCQRLRECFQNRPQHFTAVIVDEAAQCSELLTLIPLLYHSTKLVLVGDPAQLPSTVKSQKAAKLGYGQSLFERLFYYFTHANYLKYNPNPVMMLQIQYRMNSRICQFPSEQFYNGKLLTHSSCDKEILLNPLLVFDMHNGTEHSKDGCSYSNELECQLIMKMCSLLLEVKTSASIGIITPYKAQARMIQTSIKSREYHNIEIGTVDSFQGREKDIILLSCVRVQPGGSIGFLTDHRRLNVAITRARKALYIIGHLRTFQFNKHWNNLITHAEKQSIIVRVDENMNCAKECISGMKAISSLCATKNQAYIKDTTKHDEIQSSSSVTEASMPLLTIPNSSSKVVDRSAFSSQRKPIQYIEALPKTKPANSSNKNISTAGKRKLSLSNEHKSEVQASPKKVRFSLTDDVEHKISCISFSKHTKPNTLIAIKDQTISSDTGITLNSPVPGKVMNSALSPSKSATDIQKLNQVYSIPHDGTQFLSKSTGQIIEPTIDKRSSSSSKTEGISSVMFSSVHSRSIASDSSSSVMEKRVCSDKTSCSVPSNVKNSHSSLNMQSPSTSRQVEFNNVSHNYNRTEKWGGKRDRISHYNKKCDPRSKKAKPT